MEFQKDATQTEWRFERRSRSIGSMGGGCPSVTEVSKYETGPIQISQCLGRPERNYRTPEEENERTVQDRGRNRRLTKN